MAASYTYTTLKAMIISMTEDQGTEFAAAVDNLIPLAESQILRDLDIELFDTVNTLAFTASNPLVTKPTDMVATRSLHYTNAGGEFVLLMPKSWEFIKDYWPNASTTTASPLYYADYSPTQWYIAGTPLGTNVVTARCIVRPAAMTSGNVTTWMGTNLGDLLLFACLVSAEQFLKADPRIAIWKQEYTARLAGARKEFKLEDRSNYTPVATVTTGAA